MFNYYQIFKIFLFLDIDECLDNTTCQNGCINLAGSYSCVCQTGYEKFGETHCAGKLKLKNKCV